MNIESESEMASERRATYKTMLEALRNGLADLEMLCGEVASPSGVSWQDIAGTASVNFTVLASQLRQAHLGNHESFITFPSPSECMEEKAN